MNDAEFDTQQKLVQVVLDRWLTPLWLKWYSLTVNWHDERLPSESRDGTNCMMRMTTEWEYMQMTLDVSLPAIAEVESDDRLEEYVLHELCHALVNELRESDGYMRHEERVCTVLAKAFVTVKDWEWE